MFWIQILSAVLVLSEIVAYDDFEELEDMDDDDIDYYTYDDYGQATTNSKIGESKRNEARRYQEKMITRALSQSEIKEVKGAIKELFSRMGAEHPFTPFTTLKDDNFNMATYDPSDFELTFLNQSRFTKLPTNINKYKIKARKKYQKHKKSVATIPKNKDRRSKYNVRMNSEEEDEEEVPSYRRQLKPTTYKVTTSHSIPGQDSLPTITIEENLLSKTSQLTKTETSLPETKVEITTPKGTTSGSTTSEETIETTVVETTTAITQQPTVSTLPPEITETTTDVPVTVTESDDFEIDLTGSERMGSTIMIHDYVQTTETSLDTAIETTVTSKKSNKSAELDIPRLLNIIAGLASEFETNLTRKLNETLVNMSIPTCTTPTTAPPVTSEYDANYTGVTIAKCFVCGLEVTGVPLHAHCADAFAGDFLPLVPVDPTAKAKISTYRKYCKYSNIPGYSYNISHPRHIYGRWTGGCAVRWIDLSGIYTQRTCRNKLHPSTGKHYASKRMAKLEKALLNVENGCITSPMATLVPLSRAISLYARFHACVCKGSWCNTAFKNIVLPYTNMFIIFIFSLGAT